MKMMTHTHIDTHMDCSFYVAAMAKLVAEEEEEI